MKMKCLSISIVAAAVLAGLPVLDGLYVRHILTRQITKVQNELKTQVNDAELSFDVSITSYQMGYNTSDVDYLIKMTSKNEDTGKNETDSFNYREHIEHGPLVKFKNQWQLGLAAIDFSFNKTDIVKLLKKADNKIDVNYIPDISGNISSLLSLSGSRWDSYYVISPVTMNNQAANQKLTWGGLTGNLMVVTRHDRISKVESATTIGKLSLVDNKAKFGVEVTPIQMNLSTQLSNRDFYNGNFQISTDQVSAKDQESGKQIIANKIQLTAIADSAKETYGYRGDMTVAKMEFPAKLSDISSISNLKYHGEINNLSLNGYQNMVDMEKKFTDMKPTQLQSVTAAMDMVNAYFKLLTASSNIVYQISSETNLGNVALDMNVSLGKLPLNYFELADAVRVKATARAAEPLVKMIEEKDAQTKQTIDKLVANQLLIKDSKDYVLDFSYNNTTIKISGKDFKDFASVDKLMRQIFSTN